MALFCVCRKIKKFVNEVHTDKSLQSPFEQSLDFYYHFPIVSTLLRIAIGAKSTSENCNCIPNLIWIIKILKRFLCVYLVDELLLFLQTPNK